jgi:hypothetical protein
VLSGVVRSVAWSKADPLGAEFVDVRLARDELAATGVAIGSAPLPYRLDYSFETAGAFMTARLGVTARGDGWARRLDLRRSRAGVWAESWDEEGAPAGLRARAPTNLAALSDALDVDLGLSPLFNTMPALRRGMLRSPGTADFVMAWVSVPDLTVHRSPQRYSFNRVIDGERSVVRFESLADDAFVADITYDAAGIVVDYPGVGTRML